jgi:hypothetical protein
VTRNSAIKQWCWRHPEIYLIKSLSCFCISSQCAKWGMISMIPLISSVIQYLSLIRTHMLPGSEILLSICKFLISGIPKFVPKYFENYSYGTNMWLLGWCASLPSIWNIYPVIITLHYANYTYESTNPLLLRKKISQHNTINKHTQTFILRNGFLH